jgi:hypothetical protein
VTDHAPFHVAFLTNFSDTCFRAIPAVAQLCDALDVRLTIVRSHDPAVSSAHTVEATLRNFFPEADRYAECRRVALAGTPVSAVRQLATAGPLDLVVAPAGDPLGLPRLTRSSIRARLVREAVAPVWTVGPGVSAAVLGRAHRHVACVVRVGTPEWPHVGRAHEYARALGATLHVIQVMPDVHDGTMLRLAYAPPFDAVATLSRVRTLTGCTDVPLQPHVTSSSRLAAVLDRVQADIVFVDGTHWVGRRWLARRVHSGLDALQRPVVCVPDGDGRPWQIQPRRHARIRRWSEAMLAPRTPGRVPVPAIVPVPVAVPLPAPIAVPVPVAATAGRSERRRPEPAHGRGARDHGRVAPFRVVPDAI